MIDHSHSFENGKRLQGLNLCAAVVCVLFVLGSAAMTGQTAAPAAKAPDNPQTSVVAKAPISVYDGFESPTLGNMWMTQLLAPGSYAMESDVVRAGHGALRITVRPHDIFMAGSPGTTGTERDELTEAWPYTTRKNVPYEVSWSMYVAQDFPIVPVRLVVAQWWEWCHTSDLCDDNSPVLAVRYIGGELLITQDLNHKYNVLYQEKRDLRGRWLDLRFQVKFTPEATGFVRAWLDGKQVVDFTGSTSNEENSTTGYGPPELLPFRIGLYRNPMQEPMTIYFDEYRKTVLEEK